MSVIKLGLSLGVGIGDMLGSGGNHPAGNCPRSILIDLTSKKTSRMGWLLVKVILMSVIKLGLSLGVGIGDMLGSGGNHPGGNCPRTIVIDPTSKKTSRTGWLLVKETLLSTMPSLSHSSCSFWKMCSLK